MLQQTRIGLGDAEGASGPCPAPKHWRKGNKAAVAAAIGLSHWPTLPAVSCLGPHCHSGSWIHAMVPEGHLWLWTKGTGISTF